MSDRFSSSEMIYYLFSMNNSAPVLRPASNESGILPLIAGRWSSRAIDPSQPIFPEVMDHLYEAARWAPSAANNQPWRFLSFGPEDPAALEKARNSLSSGNAWALAAPRLLFILTRTDRQGSGKPNARAMYEAGMAAVQMALQAAEEGLVFHQMAGFSEEVIRTDFEVPDNFAIIAAAALGWPGSAETLPDNKKALETDLRTRKPISELVFVDGSVPGE